jgi:hypothetical protein
VTVDTVDTRSALSLARIRRHCRPSSADRRVGSSGGGAFSAGAVMIGQEVQNRHRTVGIDLAIRGLQVAQVFDDGQV